MRQTVREIRPLLILAAVVVIGVWAVQHNAAIQNSADNISSCDRGNVNRQSDYDAAKGDADDALFFQTQEHDPEIRAGWKRRYERKQAEAGRIVEAAEATGAQTAPGQVTLKCQDLYPAPSLWPF